MRSWLVSCDLNITEALSFDRVRTASGSDRIILSKAGNFLTNSFPNGGAYEQHATVFSDEHSVNGRPLRLGR